MILLNKTFTKTQLAQYYERINSCCIIIVDIPFRKVSVLPNQNNNKDLLYVLNRVTNLTTNSKQNLLLLRAISTAINADIGYCGRDTSNSSVPQVRHKRRLQVLTKHFKELLDFLEEADPRLKKKLIKKVRYYTKPYFDVQYEPENPEQLMSDFYHCTAHCHLFKTTEHESLYMVLDFFIGNMCFMDQIQTIKESPNDLDYDTFVADTTTSDDITHILSSYRETNIPATIKQLIPQQQECFIKTAKNKGIEVVL